MKRTEASPAGSMLKLSTNPIFQSIQAKISILEIAYLTHAATQVEQTGNIPTKANMIKLKTRISMK